MRDDPIWQAIKAWREADKRHIATSAKEHGGELYATKGSDRTCREYHRAAGRMARTVPTTREGAAALAKWLLRDIKMGEADWQMPALRSIVKFLRS